MALDGTISPALTPTTSSRSIDSGSETCGSDVISAKAHDKYAGVSRSYPDFPSEIDVCFIAIDEPALLKRFFSNHVLCSWQPQLKTFRPFIVL